jgi:uncharacterized damage-inducible protein DinB
MTASSSPAAAFADAFAREHEITLRVLRAFPAEQAEFRPHERSSTALQLARTFVAEGRMLLAAVRAESVLGSVSSATPAATWDDAVAQFEAQAAEVVREVGRRGDALGGESVAFFTGPKQMGEYPTMTFLWFLLHDQIHHRGQLSVYVRMAGGRVPSIYGPTADEPWT